MKNSKWLLVAGLAIMLMTIACQDKMGSIVPNGDDDVNATGTLLGRRYNNAGNWFLFFYETPTTTPETHLMSIGQDDGQNGAVKVWKDAENLYVEFNVNDPYWLNVTHVDVAADSEGLRHNKKGNLVPGQFRYHGPDPITPPTRNNTITIALSELPASTPLAMAAHCEVFYVNANGDTVWETGCGSDSTPDNPDKTIKLPDGFVYAKFTKYVQLKTDRCYWFVTLSGIGGKDQGYNVWDGEWVGWCCKERTKMPDSLQGKTVRVKLWSCYDPAQPELNAGWDNISWMINEYSGANYTPSDYFLYHFNAAVYYLLGQLPLPGPAPDASDLGKVMAQRAETEGEGYFPTLPGQYFAVVLEFVDNPEAQPIFIEVDP